MLWDLKVYDTLHRFLDDKPSEEHKMVFVHEDHGHSLATEYDFTNKAKWETEGDPDGNYKWRTVASLDLVISVWFGPNKIQICGLSAYRGKGNRHEVNWVLTNPRPFTDEELVTLDMLPD